MLVLHMVLEERSVTRAASRLHVTPPAISNALARLRELFADPLLVRSGRGLVPTPRALELLPSLREATAAMSRVLEGDGGFDPATCTRAFALACSDADHLCVVPQVAALFTHRLPRAQLRALSIDHFEASGGLEQGETDVAIAPALPLGPGLHARTLYRDDAVVVVRGDHPHARDRLTKASFNALGHVDLWLALGKGGVGNRHATAFFQEHGLERRIAMVAPSFAAAAAIVASTDLAAGMPRRIAERCRTMMGLRILELPTPPMEFQMQLVWHERTHQDAGARHFRALIQEALGEPASGARKKGRASRAESRRIA
nr:LysR family transcriptional regulator [Corallococcus exercitus]